MIPAPFRDFVHTLLHATNAVEIRWHAADNLAYFCTRNGITLHVRAWFHLDREDNAIFFRIEGREGSTPFSVRRNGVDYDPMKSLYESVIDNANDLRAFFG